MPGFVKIGMTDKNDVQVRMRELYATGLPLPFECFVAREIEGRDAQDIEGALHRAFEPYRVNPSREFFKIEPEQAEAILSVMPGKDATPPRPEQDSVLEAEERDALVTYKRQQSKTNEDDFMASLTENGTRVYRQVLALGAKKGMQVKWTASGFSLNVLSSNGPVTACFGSVRNSKYDQRIYTAFSSARQKGALPDDAINELKENALKTGLFEIVGSGDNLRCDTYRDLDDAQISGLLDFINEVTETIRRHGGHAPSTEQAQPSG